MSMTRRNFGSGFTAASFFLVLLCGQVDWAHATGSASSSVLVSTTVPAVCSISTAAITFAPYDPVNVHATVPDDQAGTIIIRCVRGTAGISIDLGGGANNSGGQRRMVNRSSPSTFLNYEVFQDMGRTLVWGRGDNGSVRSGSDLEGTGTDVYVTMYGRIPPAQISALPGTYNDTLVSAINF
jgi:spore coat protein U-like protein